jgi:hypothetical protein
MGMLASELLILMSICKSIHLLLLVVLRVLRPTMAQGAWASQMERQQQQVTQEKEQEPWTMKEERALEAVFLLLQWCYHHQLQWTADFLPHLQGWKLHFTLPLRRNFPSKSNNKGKVRSHQLQVILKLSLQTQKKKQILCNPGLDDEDESLFFLALMKMRTSWPWRRDENFFLVMMKMMRASSSSSSLSSHRTNVSSKPEARNILCNLWRFFFAWYSWTGFDAVWQPEI